MTARKAFGYWLLGVAFGGSTALVIADVAPGSRLASTGMVAGGAIIACVGYLLATSRR